MWNRAETEINPVIKLTMIRHGETNANRERRYLGVTEEPLSVQGKRKLLEKKKAGKYPAPEKLFVSPMQRCLETAELLFPGCGYERIPEWREINFGTFEGKNYRELCGNRAYQRWVDSGGVLPFPEGESRETFQRRVRDGFEKLLAFGGERLPSGSNAEIVAVVHGGTIMALFSSLSGGEYFDYQVPCGEGYSVYVQIMSDGKIKLLELKRL